MKSKSAAPRRTPMRLNKLLKALKSIRNYIHEMPEPEDLVTAKHMLTLVELIAEETIREHEIAEAETSARGETPTPA
jgi:hypothetical protein